MPPTCTLDLTRSMHLDRADYELVAVGIAENRLARLADGMTRCPEGQQPAYFIIELMARDGEHEILTMSISPCIYGFTVPGDLCSNSMVTLRS
jgi:hypothetical protein